MVQRVKTNQILQVRLNFEMGENNPRVGCTLESRPDDYNQCIYAFAFKCITHY